MHFILATVGTDGDIFPHIGLGAVLRERGHRVTLAAPETYRNRAQTFDLEFCALVTSEEVRQMLANPDLWHPFRSGWMMARWGGPMIPRQYEALAKLTDQSDCVLIANAGVLAARLVQEKRGVPMASLLLQPGLIPSCTSPPEMPGGVTIPSWLPHPLRRMYWLGVDAAGYAMAVPPLNRARKSLGLAPVRRLFRWWLSPDLVIGLFPSWYGPPQPDWPAQIRLAGFGRFDGAHAKLPDEVEKFCNDGPSPIAFTLGTGMSHAGRFFRAAVAACESMGARALLLTKFKDILPRNVPSGILHCAYAPFRQLLPRCAAVVHHGGIGTTAAALEAGCPQLVLPLAWDQPDNAARINDLGVGLSLGPRHRSSAHLAQTLSQLMRPEVRKRCQVIAQRTAGTDGFEIVADWVEQLRGTARDHGRSSSSPKIECVKL